MRLSVFFFTLNAQEDQRQEIKVAVPTTETATLYLMPTVELALYVLPSIVR